MIAIIPKPSKLALTKGNFILTSKTTVSGEFPKAIKHLCDVLLAVNGIEIKKASENGKIVFVKVDTLKSEQYRLIISVEQIMVEACDERGAFYAVQSLRQIAQMDATARVNKLEIVGCKVEDAPRFSYRGFMLDEARHFFGKDFVKRTLDMMALLKLNTFHWHLTDDQGWRVEIKKYPLLTKKGIIRSNTQLNLVGYNIGRERHDNAPYGEDCYYTQSDIKEIVAYAKNLNIEIIPEIDMPGHLVAAIACYPELSCKNEKIDVSTRWGVMDTIGCCGDDKLYEFVKNVISELVELFPSKYFHIGGDEVPKTKWKKCPKCQAKIKEHGLKNENALQGYFNNEILAFLQSKDRKMIGWNEILEDSELSDDTIVQWWTGDVTRTGVMDWIKRGNKVILSSCAHLYMDHFYSMKDLKKSYSVDLNTLGLDMKYEKNVLGIEAPQWTEYVRNKKKFDFNTYPRMQALAEIGWTARANKDFADFETRLAQFMKIMDKWNIGYAPRSYYLCEGFRGWLRRAGSQKNWTTEPNSEMNKYYKNKK